MWTPTETLNQTSNETPKKSWLNEFLKNKLEMASQKNKNVTLNETVN